MRFNTPLTILILLFFCINLFGQNKPHYPQANQSNQSDTIFGTIVKDPYRWIENIRSAEVSDWLKSEKEITQNYSGKTNSLKSFLEHYSGADYRPLIRRGNYYFLFEFNSYDQTPELYFQKKIRHTDATFLFDPNKLEKKAVISIDDIELSQDNSTLALLLTKNGSDWKAIRFLNMKTDKLLDDTIDFVRYSDASWYKNGVYYFKYDEKNKEVPFERNLKNGKLYYHKLGTKQTNDKIIWSCDTTSTNLDFFSTEKFVIKDAVFEKDGKQYHSVSIAMLNDSLSLNFHNFIITQKKDIYFDVLGMLNGKLLVQTNLYAQNGSILKYDFHYLNRPALFIPGYPQQLDFSKILQNKIISAYHNDTLTFAVIRDTLGNILKRWAIPQGYTFGHFSGNREDSILIYSFHSFFAPSSMYTININSFETYEIGNTDVAFDISGLSTKMVYYTSKDGTKIPMYLTYKTGMKLDGTNPVILYGYGGFGVPMKPFFDGANIPFLRGGGILAAPCIRGGGDYPGWHEQGKRLNKQNSFDDFIAAGEYLINNKYTSSEKMAAMGGSNGGLLVTAVMIQRPDLFKVVVGTSGVYDMMRYHLYGNANDYIFREEYGDITNSADFKNLLQYSPVQNVKPNVAYPATLLVAGENDDRVSPFHSFKLLATLQATITDTNPYILYYEKNAGHFRSDEIAANRETEAFIYAFIYKYLGIESEIKYLDDDKLKSLQFGN